MLSLIALVSAFVLFALCIGVLQYESFRGVRFFEERRIRFDRLVHRIVFVGTHVDFSSFTWQLVKDSGVHLAHAVLQLLLFGIRFLERTLTRSVRGIRLQKAETLSDSSLKTTTDFVKKTLSRVLPTKRMVKSEDKEDEHSTAA